MSEKPLKTFSVRLSEEQRKGLLEIEEISGIAAGEILRMAISSFLRGVRHNGGILFPLQLPSQKQDKTLKTDEKAKRSA